MCCPIFPLPQTAALFQGGGEPERISSVRIGIEHDINKA